MRQPQQAGNAGGIAAGTSLSSLVNRLSTSSLQEAYKTKTAFSNDIPNDFFTAAEEEKISPVIEELLTSVIGSARNGRIHITAERFRDIIVLEIEERNNYNGYALAYLIHSLEPLARTIGGYISMKGQQQLQATISFSFPDQAALSS